MSRVFCDLRSHKTPRGILPVNSNQNSPLYFRLKRKEPLCRALAEGWKKGVIFIYINKCNVQFGVLSQADKIIRIRSTSHYLIISAISVWVVPDIGFKVNADQSIETNFFSSASFLVSSFGKVT